MCLKCTRPHSVPLLSRIYGPLDRLYADLLPEFMRQAKRLTDLIWPGMAPCPVCLFRTGGPAWLYGHSNPPEGFEKHSNDLWRAPQESTELFGATQYRLGGEWTAVADYADASRPPRDVLSELFHEMHHVHQRERMPHKRWEDIGTLLTYPEALEAETLKAYENGLLAQTLAGGDDASETLARFRASRRRRSDLLGAAALELEGRIETMEGPALYCQARCLQELKMGVLPDGAGAIGADSALLQPLHQLSWGRNLLRQTHMARGLAMCLLLDRLAPSAWKSRLFNGEMLIGGLLEEHGSNARVNLPDLRELRLQLKALGAEADAGRGEALEEFLSAGEESLALAVPHGVRVVGMDPMSARMIEPGVILHPRMLRLEGPEGLHLWLQDVPVLARVEGSIWKPSQLLFHLPGDDCLARKNGRTVVGVPGISLDWPTDSEMGTGTF